MSTHPSPDSYSSGINITFRGPMLGCINLILNFMLSEVAFDRISKLATFEASATAVNYYDNVLQRTSQVMVPVALPAGVDHLRPRTAITVREWSVSMDISPMFKDTCTRNKTGYFVRPVSSIDGGWISIALSSAHLLVLENKRKRDRITVSITHYCSSHNIGHLEPCGRFIKVAIIIEQILKV
jgi:hypothetical protein